MTSLLPFSSQTMPRQLPSSEKLTSSDVQVATSSINTDQGFTLFLRLPVEIRLLIWGFAQRPRILRLGHVMPGVFVTSKWGPFTTTDPYVRLVSANKESHNEALRIRASRVPIEGADKDQLDLPINPGDTIFIGNEWYNFKILAGEYAYTAQTEIPLPLPELLSVTRSPERNLPSLMFSETMLRQSQLALFMHLDDLSRMVGKASQYTRAKVLQPGLEVEPGDG
jgi:hypothetical protein